MELADRYERARRGLYSGAIGYFEPGGDFDFNVVIRSFQYNARAKYLNYMAGSAITALSEAGKEYKECLLKAKAVHGVLSRTNDHVAL
jgi:para-aminobenzoate synthetase component 1